jgi:hypothetical protein
MAVVVVGYNAWRATICTAVPGHPGLYLSLTTLHLTPTISSPFSSLYLLSAKRRIPPPHLLQLILIFLAVWIGALRLDQTASRIMSFPSVTQRNRNIFQDALWFVSFTAHNRNSNIRHCCILLLLSSYFVTGMNLPFTAHFIQFYSWSNVQT